MLGSLLLIPSLRGAEIVGITATHVSVHELVMGCQILVKFDFDTVSDTYFGSNNKKLVF